MSSLPLAPSETGEQFAPSYPDVVKGVRRRRWAGVLQGGRFLAVGDQVVYSFGNLAVAALLSRHCAARELGIYILTQRALDVLIQLSNVFLWAPYTFHMPGTAQDLRARYLGSLLCLQIAFCCLATLLLYGTAAWTSAARHGHLAATFAALVLPTGSILFREFTRRLYFAHLRLHEAFWTEVATVALQVAGVQWLWVQHQLTVAHTLLVLGAGALAVNVWWCKREWRTLAIEPAAVLEDLRRDLKLGRWFFGSNMVFLASAQCNPWMLSGMLGGASVGAYAICESIVNIPRVALTSMQNVMGPMLARAHRDSGTQGVHTLVRRMNWLLLAGSCVFCVAVLCCAPALAHLIYHRAPAGTRLIVTLLGVNLVLYASTLAQSYGLTAVNRADTTLYANLAGLIVQAAVTYTLIQRFQLPGAALALAVGNLVVLLVRHRFYTREMNA